MTGAVGMTGDIGTSAHRAKISPNQSPKAQENIVSRHPLSVQLYTVRNALELDLESTLERVASLGFTTVELYNFVDRASEYASLLPQFGLRPSSAHVHLVGAELPAVFDAANAVGVSTIIEPLVDAERWTTAADIAATATELNSASAAAASAGLIVGYHNHWWELENSIDGVTALEVFESLLDPAVVLEVDTYWATVAGTDASALLTRLGDRVRFIHVKDGDISKVDENQTAVGSGRVPVAQILAAAPQAVRVVELDDFAGDVFDALADSVSFLVANGEHV